ncbi:polyprenyl synthetase family protein [Natranaerobius thermophilus]|uniref:Polyprenyl synthetase n=1 Tax=Natranaerobius thermophilus (strain ATCC BAA-1301 / DSM 18059 / JW/NM-WN-LF) TaxID=457570 RepID=B2A232_NATTJ|nr:polyprenyl synthetase family protein [Natranaerobius thermophilus]ACB84837.1 Polyprenyl synthetase [Natranaerobius thermophilus JW/NM-WN-LF]
MKSIDNNNPQIANFKSLILQNLQETLLNDGDTEVQSIINHLLSRQGKLFRPVLVYLSANIHQVDKDRVLKTAMASELIHLASLVHDDIIDNSDYRRGKQTVNYYWGNKSAVLVGDYLFSKAFSILAMIDSPKIMALFTDAISKMCQGELIQLNNAFKSGISREIYFKVIEYKTAALLAACCESGAILSSGNGKSCKSAAALKNYGLHLGRAYQIIDDVMDYTVPMGSSEKPRGKDLTEGIITLPVILLMEKNELTGQELEEFWQAGPTPNQFSLLVRDLNNNRCITEALRIAEHELNLANQYLTQISGEYSELDVLFSMKSQLLQRVNKLQSVTAEI